MQGDSHHSTSAGSKSRKAPDNQGATPRHGPHARRSPQSLNKPTPVSRDSLGTPHWHLTDQPQQKIQQKGQRKTRNRQVNLNEIAHTKLNCGNEKPWLCQPGLHELISVLVRASERPLVEMTAESQPDSRLKLNEGRPLATIIQNERANTKASCDRLCTERDA